MEEFKEELCIYADNGTKIIQQKGNVCFDNTNLDTKQHHYSVVDDNGRRHHYKVPFEGFLITVSRALKSN
jgi:hypothetical protein